MKSGLVVCVWEAGEGGVKIGHLKFEFFHFSSTGRWGGVTILALNFFISDRWLEGGDQLKSEVLHFGGFRLHHSPQKRHFSWRKFHCQFNYVESIFKPRSRVFVFCVWTGGHLVETRPNKTTGQQIEESERF